MPLLRTKSKLQFSLRYREVFFVSEGHRKSEFFMREMIHVSFLCIICCYEAVRLNSNNPSGSALRMNYVRHQFYINVNVQIDESKYV